MFEVSASASRPLVWDTNQPQLLLQWRLPRLPGTRKHHEAEDEIDESGPSRQEGPPAGPRRRNLASARRTRRVTHRMFYELLPRVTHTCSTSTDPQTLLTAVAHDPTASDDAPVRKPPGCCCLPWLPVRYRSFPAEGASPVWLRTLTCSLTKSNYRLRPTETGHRR